jgi:squalene-hopene/tetraprenyl-beta-curcumene cyclase
MTVAKRIGTTLSLLAALAAAPVVGMHFETTAHAAEASKREAVIEKAVAYLGKAQAANGSFSEQSGPAITAMAVAGLLESGRPVDDPVVAKGLKYVEGFIQKDGGVYKAEGHKNYETCVAIMCFAAANKDGRYSKQIKAAEASIREWQWDKGEGIEDSDVKYGGAGYGGSKRPDLSNTQMFLDALKASGAGPDDPAVKAALKFVSQCQNLESEHNTGTFAAKNPDGGFIYTAAGTASSVAGATPNGGLRSYGSMTYAGLKSMIYAGVKADDPRVKAAMEWARKHYDLKSNPGLGDSGLYYYYQTFAKAMAASGQAEFTDAKGVKHNWREELVAELANRQNPDGSWTNSTNRFMEGDPNLVTGYALLTLAQCKEPASK